MLEMEEINEQNIENEKNQEQEINLLKINSFEYLFDLLKTEKYKINNFSNDLKNFCIESEKNNYICEKIDEFKILNEESLLFEKFILCKNRFDFQISMSYLLINFLKFVKNNKPSNKKEYNIIKNIFRIFTEIKNNNLLMEDIQCLIEYGVLKDYNNNFYLFLFDINEKNVKDILFFFNLKKYFLSNINQINIFIFKFNEFIDSNANQEKLAMFIKKLETILYEILIMLNGNNENDKDDNIENKHKMEIYKEKIINSVNKAKIFELYFSDIMFTSHLDVLLNLFKIFPGEIDKQINYLISKNDKQITKTISKFLIKNASFIDDYIEKETLFLLNELYIENTFYFYINQYIEGKNRLINIYNMFKNNKKIINILIYILKNKLKKEKQAELIEKRNYNEEDEYELEEKEFEKNNNNYFYLPYNYKIYYISCEDEIHTKESFNILNNLINSNKCIDEYLGIDTEWKSSPTFLDFYYENLSDKNKNIEIININKTNLSDIIQIAGINYGFIFDTKSIYNNEEIKKKIEILFSKSKFIGFEFQNDIKKIGVTFKKIVYKNTFIELSTIYTRIKNRKAPELKIITLELFDKVLDKRDQISDWSSRPLLSYQIKYGILDAYVLILIYKKLYEEIKEQKYGY